MATLLQAPPSLILFLFHYFFLIAAQFCNFWSFVARPWSKLLQRTSQLSPSQTARKTDRQKNRQTKTAERYRQTDRLYFNTKFLQLQTDRLTSICKWIREVITQSKIAIHPRSDFKIVFSIICVCSVHAYALLVYCMLGSSSTFSFIFYVGAILTKDAAWVRQSETNKSGEEKKWTKEGKAGGSVLLGLKRLRGWGCGWGGPPRECFCTCVELLYYRRIRHYSMASERW